MKIRKGMRFYGYVQGVGFRWRACSAAKRTGVSGWVRNEYDGSVSMEIQGDPELIDKTVEMIKAGQFVDIDRVEQWDLPLDEDEWGFRER